MLSAPSRSAAAKFKSAKDTSGKPERKIKMHELQKPYQLLGVDIVNSTVNVKTGIAMFTVKVTRTGFVTSPKNVRILPEVWADFVLFVQEAWNEAVAQYRLPDEYLVPAVGLTSGVTDR